MVQRGQVLAPVRVDALQHHRALEAGKGLAADLRDLGLVTLGRGRDDHLQQFLVLDALRVLDGLRQRQLQAEVVAQALLQAGDVPLLFHRFGRHVLAEQIDQHALAQALDHLADVLRLEHLVAQLVDFLALVVGDVVVLQQLLADIEVAALDLALRRFDRARDDAGLDRFALGHLQAVHDRAHAVAGEDAQQLVVQRQIEARRTRVALAAGAAAQLVVDPARFVALGADDMQAARGLDLLVQRLPFRLQLRDARGLVVVRQIGIGLDEAGLLLDVAAQHDVGTAARHVGGDRDHLRPTRLRDDLRLARVLLGVEHLVRQLFLVQQVRQVFRGLDRRGADQHRLPALVAFADIADHGVVALLGRLEDLILEVLALGRLVGRDHDHFQAVDLLEFIGFGVGRAGHAGQLLVHPEVVLERDRRQRLVFLLDGDAFLGLDRLVQAVGPAAARHQAAGEFVDDDDLVVLHHVVLVAMEQAVRAQRGVQMVHQRDVLRRVQRFALADQAQLRHDLLGLLVARFGQVDLVRLLVDVVVARLLDAGAVRLLLADLALEQLRDAVHALVQVGMVLRLARDDQRGARLVDQDRVDLVDDRIVQRPLHALTRVVDHVVAQVVEAEFVVGAVGDVAVVGRLLLVVRHLRQVDANRQPEEVVQPAHPLGIALRQVVVDRDHVHALAGQRVQVDRQRRGQGLALAGTHLRDLVVVQHHAADQLHVEMAHLHHAFAGLAADREGFGQQRLERFAAGVALAELFGHAAQLVVRQRFELRLQRVDPLDCPSILFDQPLVTAAEDFLEKARDHRLVSPAHDCGPAVRAAGPDAKRAWRRED